MPGFALLTSVPSRSIGTTLNSSNFSPRSSGYSSPSHIVSFPNSLFLLVLHVLKFLQPSPEEQNCQVLKMHCRRGEKDGIPPRQAGWTPIVLSWLAAVKIPLQSGSPYPFVALTHWGCPQPEYTALLPAFLYVSPLLYGLKGKWCIWGKTKKNGAFWISEGTWQGDREAQAWLCPNFPVNEWFLRGKNFHSFVYKPEGVGNPQIILVGTLKDCMKLHKNIQNFPKNFGACVTVTWQLCAFFSYETSCQLKDGWLLCYMCYIYKGIL